MEASFDLKDFHSIMSSCVFLIKRVRFLEISLLNKTRKDNSKLNDA